MKRTEGIKTNGIKMGEKGLKEKRWVEEKKRGERESHIITDVSTCEMPSSKLW